MVLMVAENEEGNKEENVKENKAKYKVTIISRTEVTTFPKVNVPLVSKQITYQAEGLPPRTIWIKKDEWTLEKEKGILHADIDAQFAMKPEEIEV